MGIKVKETAPGQIQELRDRFNSKYESSPPSAPFHPVDIDRIRNDHVWLQRFLEMYDHDMDTSFTKLWDTCAWRQSYGANDLDESQLNQEYLREGSVFVRSSDVDGKPLLIFRVCLHSKSKNLDELIRIVVYWIERTQREQHMTQMTVFFDMANTGLATMDLDFVKRIVETFKQYYPNCLNYILVYELAWILNAAFKVIKALLPPKAVEILKMISKKDINQFIPKDKCLASWGGGDNYEFSFVPEAKQATAKSLAANAGEDEQFADRKVTFASPATMVLKESNINEMHTPSEGMLQVDPKEFLNFNSKNAEATLNLKSISKSAVTYKIQTTSPEKFRVRPRCGIIQPNQSAAINIWLKTEHQLSGESKDKFLVMAMVVPGDECEVTDLWRNKSPSAADVEQHRLVCRQDDKTSKTAAEGPNKTSKANVDCKKSGAGLSAADAMARQLAFTQNLQYVTLALMVLLFAGFGFLMYQQLGHHHSSTCPKELNDAHRDSDNNNKHNQGRDCQELENYCACAFDLMDLGLDCADTINQIDGDGYCLEALIQAQLQLCRRCYGSGDRQLGGVAAGGHLLGLIAFARKLVRVVLSLSLLCGILFVSFYLGSNYGVNSTTTITTSLATIDSGARGNRQPCYYS